MKTLLLIFLVLSLFNCNLKTKRFTVDLFWIFRIAALVLFCVNY